MKINVFNTFIAWPIQKFVTDLESTKNDDEFTSHNL